LLLSIGVVVVAYLLGSVSFSIIVSRLKGIKDIRQHGSGNAGATNTLRVLGKGPAFIVYVLDFLKGVAAVLLASKLVPGSPWVADIAAVAAVIGHNWPIFFGFRGGKGVATTQGVLLTMAWFPVVMAMIPAFILLVVMRYVSLASIVFSILTPISVWYFGESYSVLAASFILMLFTLYRHKQNIVQLRNGTERKLGQKTS
jgi:glycerol-3-phosphate acyltransferase PlsY